jgi:hypothetical protein
VALSASVTCPEVSTAVAAAAALVLLLLLLLLLLISTTTVSLPDKLLRTADLKQQ